MLPDNALLEIFDFYEVDLGETRDADIGWIWSQWWKKLIQVCRRWRGIILSSPRRLNLRVICTNNTPTRTLLDIWPLFPVVIRCRSPQMVDEEGVENIIAAVEHPDRISQILIHQINGRAWERLSAAMNKSFPNLTAFALRLPNDDSAPVLPETFLGGSAPRLRILGLNDAGFPSFPKFILSSTLIRHIWNLDIPTSGYISPEEMVNCLAALPSLDYLSFGFRSPLSRPLRTTRPHLTRLVLPALARLRFSGVSEYFEDFIARIDTPRLYKLSIEFFMDIIFDIPRLRDFVCCTEWLKSPRQAIVSFSRPAIKIQLESPRFNLDIRCERPDWQLSSITQVFDQQLPLLSCVERLTIRERRWPHIKWKDDPDMDPSQWLELFRLFIFARNLHVSKGLVPHVGAALLELNRGEVMEVLPVLVNLYLEGHEPSGSMQEGIKSFVTSRQLSDQPVIVRRWE